MLNAKLIQTPVCWCTPVQAALTLKVDLSSRFVLLVPFVAFFALMSDKHFCLLCGTACEKSAKVLLSEIVAPFLPVTSALIRR